MHFACISLNGFAVFSVLSPGDIRQLASFLLFFFFATTPLPSEHSTSMTEKARCRSASDSDYVSYFFNHIF